LPAIADGSATAALAWTTRAGRWDDDDVACVSRSSGAGGRELDGEAHYVLDGEAHYVLDGEAHYVLDGEGADVLLVATRGPEGVGLFEVNPVQDGVHRTAAAAMDASRRLAVVRLAGVRGQRIGGDAAPALSRARDLACLALSAEQVGAARRALDLTVGYTMTRVQFGRVIGSFQALQHRLADLHVLVESARSLSRALAAGDSAAGDFTSGGSASGDSASGDSASGDSASGDSASGGSASGDSAWGDAPALGLRAAAAKVYCSEALMRTAAEMIQLHGAIGITWEHQAHRYLKRAHGGLHLFGRPAQHAAAIAASLIDR
jgi:alkylation response protein AidB-like acyl-CoA dehydrogenase